MVVNMNIHKRKLFIIEDPSDIMFQHIEAETKGRHFMQMSFSNAFPRMKIPIKIWIQFVSKGSNKDIPPLVQATNHYLNQWWLVY